MHAARPARPVAPGGAGRRRRCRIRCPDRQPCRRSRTQHRAEGVAVAVRVSCAGARERDRGLHRRRLHFVPEPLGQALRLHACPRQSLGQRVARRRRKLDAVGPAQLLNPRPSVAGNEAHDGAVGEQKAGLEEDHRLVERHAGVAAPQLAADSGTAGVAFGDQQMKFPRRAIVPGQGFGLGLTALIARYRRPVATRRGRRRSTVEDTSR